MTLAVTAGTIGIGGCDADIVAPRALPPSELRAVPTSIALSGRTLVLETYLWRDFSPPSPPNGVPLIAVLRVRTADGSPIPSSVTADGAWIVLGEDVWATAVAHEQRRDPTASSFAVVAREGPKWQPGATVDVIVCLREGDRHYRLRAASQPIHRTS